MEAISAAALISVEVQILEEEQTLEMTSAVALILETTLVEEQIQPILVVVLIPLLLPAASREAGEMAAAASQTARLHLLAP